MKKIIYLLLLLIFYQFSYTQIDTTMYRMEKYDNSFRFEDGLYLTIYEAQNNSPIVKNKIICSLNSQSPDFFDKLLEKDKILIYNNSGLEQTLQKQDIWGYANNGILYINKNNDFWRIGVAGSLCHFVAIEEVFDPSITYPYTYDGYTTVKTTEMVQYILDFKTGEIYLFNPKSVEILLMPAPELYDEYLSLSRKKRKNLAFVYIRKYNEKNSTLVPVKN